MSKPGEKINVPGNNNVTYGPVPKEEQLFQVEFLEIAPSPIPLDKFFLSYSAASFLNPKKFSRRRLMIPPMQR
ncbi:hypothetical protein F4680DRAFT_443995 [Xylaria scruposa]|nr:hypothetical protein F4680DRAFT_443995 [Xylaria scruposa]